VIEGSLHCRACGRGYPIKEGVPDFVVEPCLRATNRLQKALYDRLEARLAELSGFSEEELRREVVSRMEIGERDSVLEICVGTGGNIPYFREYTKGPIAGLDISEGMLSTCRKRALEEDWGEVELFLGCAEYLPFADEVFDRVLIGGGISYFSDPKRALAEAARVAKRKAKVVVYEQFTILERLLRRDRPPLEILPPTLFPLRVAYPFGGRFYILELLRD